MIIMNYKNVFITIYFFIYRVFIRKPIVLSSKETIKRIINERLSISRFGDGEISLMMKTGGPKFQSASDELSDDLWLSFNKRSKNLLICLSKIDFRFPYKSIERDHYKRYLYYTFRKALRQKKIDFRYKYGNTDLTRFYHPALYKKTNFKKLERYVFELKKIWNSRKLVIVEGEETKLGVGNDLFDNALSIKRIICPSRNAYFCKDKIINAIKANCSEDCLVLLSLGPTASIVSAYISTETNIQIVDVGHVDVVYIWFLYRAKENKGIEHKTVNETNTDEQIKLNVDMTKYESEIIVRI